MVMKQKRAYKFTFKKWRLYLSPKCRKWLKEVNTIMNSEEIAAQTKKAAEEGIRDVMCYGTSVICHDENGIPHSVPPYKFFHKHPEIRDKLS